MALSPKDLRELYEVIFPADEDPAALKQLRLALLEYRSGDPDGTAAPANEAISDLLGRAVQGSPVQLRALKQFFTWREVQAVSPIKLGESEPRPNLMKFYARFFRQDAFPQDLQELQHRLYDLKAWRGPENRAGVLSVLRRTGPETRWTKREIEALSKMMVEDTRFEQLAPWDPGVGLW